VSETASPPADIRTRIVEATMHLAATHPFEELTISEIAAEAGVTLLEFRDAFPSKGAVLAGLSRMIDRQTLGVDYAFRENETAQDRLFAVLSRRLDALGPYRAGLRSVRRWLRKDWASAVEINRLNVNAMRFACEAARVPAGGAFAGLKLQGLALAWARVLDVWLNDEEDSGTRALGVLSAELARGERAVAGLDGVERVISPALGRLGDAFKTAKKAGDETAGDDDLATRL
jgi:AcrR family transcriptional regulator